MIRPTTTIAGLTCCLALALAGCSSSDGAADGSATTTSTATAATGAPEPATAGTEPERTSGSTAPAGQDAPDGPATISAGTCEAVSADLLAEAFPGVAFDAPQPTQGERRVNDVRWIAEACRWESATVTVRAAVAGPDGFTGGFVCAEPTGGVSEEGPVEVTGLGEQAWWTWDDFNGANANLAVCSGELRVDVDVDAPNGVEVDPDAALEGAKAIAGALL